jgi:DNA invertase Pin-like site-specific DNA recombinase
MRIATYVRMSTAKQDQSPEQQRAAIAAHCSKHGHTVVAEYSDLGISGDRAVRPGFEKMLADAQRKQFARIVCYDRSRFGRFDAIGFGEVMAPLRKARVILETVADGIVDLDSFGGRINGIVEQEGKHAFVVDLSLATTRGLTAKAMENRGYTGGKTPYGYDRTTRVEGRNRVSTLSLNDITAPIVARMFAAYAGPAASLQGVVRMLNMEHVPPPEGGGQWRRSSALRILTNRVYVGDAVWGRRATGKYHTRSGAEIVKRLSHSDVEWHDPIVHADAVPAIVTRDLFARVQTLMIERQQQRRSPAKVRPLTGIVHCAHCGKPMHSDGAGLMRCPRSTAAIVTGCSGSRVSTGPLLAAVVAGIRKHLLAPKVTAKIEKRIREMLTSADEDPDVERKRLGDQLRKINAEIAAGTERIPMIPAAILPGFLKTLDERAAARSRLEGRLEALEPAREPSVTKAIREAIKGLRALEDVLLKADPAEVNAALRSLRVVVKTAPRSSGKTEADREADVIVGGLSTTEGRCGPPGHGRRR